MFGYVQTNRPELKVKDLERYRAYYCGVCSELHRQYGRRGQLVLSYDCTFAAILLDGLYEPEDRERMVRCLAHPQVKHHEIVSRFSTYAADMNVLLGYLKAADDWRDEKKQTSRIAALALHEDYLKIRERWPRQAREISASIAALHKIEEREIPEERAAVFRAIDEAAGCSGRMFAAVLAPEKDAWSDTLRKTGFYLGKFIYLIDAYDDMRKDEEDGSYNILLALKRNCGEGFDAQVKDILMDTAACCCRFFEYLPIIRNVDILRNILYSGLWVRFYEISQGTQKGSGKKDSALCDTIYR